MKNVAIFFTSTVHDFFLQNIFKKSYLFKADKKTFFLFLVHSFRKDSEKKEKNINL